MDQTKFPKTDNPAAEEKADIWQKKRDRINGKRKPLSKWHAYRLMILQDKDDFASFIQYIKWMGGNPPKTHDEIEYLEELTKEFDSLGGYEFFEEHGLDLPPIGIGGYESTFFD